MASLVDIPSSCLGPCVGAVVVVVSSSTIGDDVVAVFCVSSRALLVACWWLVGPLLPWCNYLLLSLWLLVSPPALCLVLALNWVAPTLVLVVPQLLAVVVAVVDVVLPALPLRCKICKDNGFVQCHTVAWFHSSKLYTLRRNVPHCLLAEVQLA